MADKKISDLTAGAPAQSTDAIPIARAGANFKLTLSDLSAVVGTAEALNIVAASGASQTINYATADVWDITLTANCTFTLSGFTNAKPDYLTLVIRQDGTGSRTVTWPAITWIGSGIAPILQTAASSVDSVVLFSFDGGSTVFGIAQTSASGLKAGTSFPGSPADGDLFYRTDRRILYEYASAVTSWLSLDRKYVTVGDPAAGTTNSVSQGIVPLPEKVYLEKVVSQTDVSTTNDGSNFYTIVVRLLNLGAGTTTAIGSYATGADTVGNFTLHTLTVGAVYDPATYAAIQVTMSSTGTPGTHLFGHMLILRSVG